MDIYDMKSKFLHDIETAFNKLHIKYIKHTQGTDRIVYYMKAPKNSMLHDLHYFMYSLRIDSPALRIIFTVINVFGIPGTGNLKKLLNAIENTNNGLDIGRFIIFNKCGTYQVNYINDLGHISTLDGFASQLRDQFELFYTAMKRLSSYLEKEGFDFCLDV